jgi:hypothetical protein
MPLDKTRMGELHELHVAEVLGGRRARGSGNQWDDPGDGRHDHTKDMFAFAWDCKSTTGLSITITDKIIDKITDQAGGERPAIPLRWYGNQALTLVDQDWIAVRLDDFEELLLAARREMEPEPAQYPHPDGDVMVLGPEIFASPDKMVISWQGRNYAPQDKPAEELPGYVTPLGPMETRTIIYSNHTPDGQLVNQGVRWLPTGAQELFKPREVILERSVEGASRLSVDHEIMTHADWYLSGQLKFTVG